MTCHQRCFRCSSSQSETAGSQSCTLRWTVQVRGLHHHEAPTSSRRCILSFSSSSETSSSSTCSSVCLLIVSLLFANAAAVTICFPNLRNSGCLLSVSCSVLKFLSLHRVQRTRFDAGA